MIVWLTHGVTLLALVLALVLFALRGREPGQVTLRQQRRFQVVAWLWALATLVACGFVVVEAVTR